MRASGFNVLYAITHSCPTIVTLQVDWEALNDTPHTGAMELAGSTCRPEELGILAWGGREASNLYFRLQRREGAHSFSSTEVCSTTENGYISSLEQFRARMPGWSLIGTLILHACEAGAYQCSLSLLCPPPLLLEESTHSYPNSSCSTVLSARMSLWW